MPFICLFLFILLAYIALIAFFARGWAKIPDEIEGNDLPALPEISVVVACRNEAKNLPVLLQSLKNQTIQNFELILINDGSTDNTLDVMNDYASDFQIIILSNNESKGKKHALAQGILAAKNELVVSTDADCTMPSKWLETILDFQTKTDCDLIVLPVAMEDNGSVISKMQQLEFASLVLSGAGAVGAGNPILCNGANLAFKRAVWLANKENIHAEQPSGDDVFLLESVKQRGGKICFLKSENVLATTAGAENLLQFFKQRRRWASKSPAYTNKLLIFTAIAVFSISLTEILALIFGFFYPKYWVLLAIIFCLKYLADLGFLRLAQSFFQLKNLAVKSLLLSLVYPFYICTTALSALFFQPKTWK